MRSSRVRLRAMCGRVGRLLLRRRRRVSAPRDGVAGDMAAEYNNNNNIVNNYYIKFINRRVVTAKYTEVYIPYNIIYLYTIVIIYNIISGPSFTAWKCGLRACACTSRLEYYSARAHPPGDRICRPRVCAGCVCVCVFKPLPRRNRVHRPPSVCSFRERPRRTRIIYYIICARLYADYTIYIYIYIHTDVEIHII